MIVLKSYLGFSNHHVHNTQDIIQSIQDIKLQDNECMMSYDVHSIFTSIPVDPAILITPTDDGSLQTSVYRKPTHTDLYLQWDSHHTIPSKYSVVGTLYHRAKTICSNQEMLLKEKQHLFQALKKCKYPTWALNRVKMRCQQQKKK